MTASPMATRKRDALALEANEERDPDRGEHDGQNVAADAEDELDAHGGVAGDDRILSCGQNGHEQHDHRCNDENHTRYVSTHPIVYHARRRSVKRRARLAAWPFPAGLRSAALLRVSAVFFLCCCFTCRATPQLLRERISHTG